MIPNCHECGNPHLGECPPLEDGDYSDTMQDVWARYPNAMSDNMGY